MFRVGDLVIGKKGASNRYHITTEAVVCKVVRISDDRSMYVEPVFAIDKILKTLFQYRTYNNYDTFIKQHVGVGLTYNVDCRHFMKYVNDVL